MPYEYVLKPLKEEMSGRPHTVWFKRNGKWIKSPSKWLGFDDISVAYRAMSTDDKADAVMVGTEFMKAGKIKNSNANYSMNPRRKKSIRARRNARKSYKKYHRIRKTVHCRRTRRSR